MPELDTIRGALSRYRPVEIAPNGQRQAAVVMLLGGAPQDPDVLFIERAHRPGDPWSGHMAFPGGRAEPQDAHIRDAAERETLEEVGIPLVGSEPLGRLDDMQGHRAAGHPGIVVSAFVYHLPEPPSPVPNHEVQEAFWFPLRALHEPARQVDYALRRAADRRFPGIRVGQERHVVWGLTYRFLEHFFAVVGRPFPHRWE